MEQQLSTRTALHPGQTMHFHAKRGLTVVAAKGAIRLVIALPGEQAMQQTIALHEGEAHVVHEGGWLAISTRFPAEVACIAKETWIGPLWRRCLGMATEHRRRWRSLVT